jgi:hypothetical protein
MLSEDDSPYGDGYDDVDIKEALGLPDSLPPIRLPSLPELAALARQAPLPRQLDGLAAWVGADGREVTEDGLLTGPDTLAAAAAVGVAPDDLAYLWEYAFAGEWLRYDDDDDELVVPGELAGAWRDGDDGVVFDIWSTTLAAVLDETLLVPGPAADEDWEELGFGELSFDGQPMALAVLLFLARREGLLLADFTEVLWEGACGDLPAEQAALVRARWLASYEDPVRLILDKLTELRAVTESGDSGETIRLTSLAQAALHEQLADAGVDIPLLPPTAAELTGAELLAMAEGVGDEEFEAESDAWIAARGADAGARELLALAAAGGPGERMLAVAAVTRIGAAAGPAWRDSVDVPQVRAYAKVALAELAGLAGGQTPPGLEPLPEDVAWLTTDMVALACDEEFPDPDEIVASLREAIPEGQEAAVFELMWRSAHPDVVDVLQHVGKYHPDKQIAKAARTAAYRAASRRASRQ